MGDVVLADLLNGKGLLPLSRKDVDYYLADVASTNSVPSIQLLKLGQRLRAKGHSVGYALNGGKLKKQLEEANNQGAHRLIFFGSDRAPAGFFEVKDLGTGEQKILQESEL